MMALRMPPVHWIHHTMPGLGSECFQGLVPEQTGCKQLNNCAPVLSLALSLSLRVCGYVCVCVPAGICMYVYICGHSIKSTTVWKKKKREIAVFELKTCVSLPLSLCVCVCAAFVNMCFVCVHVGVCACVNIGMRMARNEFWGISPSTTFYLTFWGRVAHWTGSSPVCLGCLARECQGPCSLCLPNRSILPCLNLKMGLEDPNSDIHACKQIKYRYLSTKPNTNGFEQDFHQLQTNTNILKIFFFSTLKQQILEQMLTGVSTITSTFYLKLESLVFLILQSGHCTVSKLCWLLIPKCISLAVPGNGYTTLGQNLVKEIMLRGLKDAHAAGQEPATQAWRPKFQPWSQHEVRRRDSPLQHYPLTWTLHTYTSHTHITHTHTHTHTHTRPPVGM